MAIRSYSKRTNIFLSAAKITGEDIFVLINVKPMPLFVKVRNVSV
jgi:hypothetical protein